MDKLWPSLIMKDNRPHQLENDKNLKLSTITLMNPFFDTL